jgi:hypothetical protein
LTTEVCSFCKSGHIGDFGDTGDKFIAGVVDTCEQLIAGVMYTGENINSQISPQIFKKI